MKRLLPVSGLLFLFSGLFSQSVTDAAVQLSAAVQANPPQITLSWLANTTGTQYQVYRKDKNGTAWGSPLATLGASATQYIDNTVVPGANYEYFVQRLASGYSGRGYINSGIEVPEVSFRGKLILIVDSTFIAPLAGEISRLITDMEGDGWQVIRHDVLRNSSVTHVKELIVTDFNLDSANVKTVFLLGHVAVPYSGNISPDGHPDHMGAWPADCYYGDIDGIWTDVQVTSTTLSPARTQNVPGDGKFDQSSIPGDLELQVGRVDFHNMPVFTATEQQLLKNYLDKDHEYRKKIFVPLKRAVVDDNFGYFNGEAFAASAYKNFAPLVGSANITVADYFTSMSSGSYAWSYGCGGGSYTSASGIGSSSNFTASALQGVFTMMFGSYFGDWDSQNNFLKAPLAQGKTLTNVWSGRPHYQFHHMGLGENIGYSVLQTQNNPGNLYYTGPTAITGRWVHNALMGDPTLRNDIVAPVSNVVAAKSGYDCVISWSSSSETNLAGYNLYMKNDTSQAYVKLNSAPITASTYTDNCLLYKGTYTYMVRALKLEQVPSGSYYNMSEGIADTAYNSSTIKTHAAFTSVLSGDKLNFNNTSANATSYLWDFGDGQSSTSANPEVTYGSNAMYTIRLIAINQCASDTAFGSVSILEVGLKELARQTTLNIFPNPANGKITISDSDHAITEISVFSTEGKVVAKPHAAGNTVEMDLSDLKKGMYFIQVRSGGRLVSKKMILE